MIEDNDHARVADIEECLMDTGYVPSILDVEFLVAEVHRLEEEVYYYRLEAKCLEEELRYKL